MDTTGKELGHSAISAGEDVRVDWRSRVEWWIGAFLVAGSGFAALVCLQFIVEVVLGSDGSWSMQVGDVLVSGRLGVLTLTPVVLGLAATQGLLGIGLIRRRPWVGWFAILYVLSGMLGVGLMKILGAVGLSALVAPALGTLPMWVLLARRGRSNEEVPDQIGSGAREGMTLGAQGVSVDASESAST